MKLISFDVGIKNMAYCIFWSEPDMLCSNIVGERINSVDVCSAVEGVCKENTNNIENLAILDWNVLNLMDVEAPTQICSCVTPPKMKKSKNPKNTLSKSCTKLAKYQKNGQYYCDKHAKTNTQYLLPTKQRTLTQLKKLKVADLFKVGQSHLCFINVENPEKLKKGEMLSIVDGFFEKNCFEHIMVKKTKTAGDTDLIKIGKNMKTLLNQVLHIDEITHVIIENQISPIANRMKTIQGMLAQYFIMKNSDVVIEFVSSANKLKQFMHIECSTDEIPINNTDEPKTPTDNYKQHKTDGVYYCSQILNKNPCFEKWKDALNTKKKDDLADSFLQGIWYLKSKNIIMNAEDLKINIV